MGGGGGRNRVQVKSVWVGGGGRNRVQVKSVWVGVGEEIEYR